MAEDLSRAPTQVLIDMATEIGESLAGREVQLRSSDGDVTFVFDRLRSEHNDPPAWLGAFRPGLDIEGAEWAEIDAHDVRWDGGRIDRIQLHVRDVRVEAGVQAVMVTGPVGISAEVDQATLDWWLQKSEVDLRVELDGGDRALVSRGPNLRGVVTGHLVDDHVVFSIDRAWWRGLPIPWPNYWAARRGGPPRVPIPHLPRAMQVTAMIVRPGVLRVNAVMPGFREPVALDQIMRAVSTVSSRVVVDRVRPTSAAR